jgi:hypothetical protein
MLRRGKSVEDTRTQEKKPTKKDWKALFFKWLWIWLRVFLIFIMVVVLILIYASGKLKVGEVFWASLFSSLMGIILTLLFSIFSEVIRYKRDNIPTDELSDRCPVDSLPCMNKFPCHAPHIIAVVDMQKAWKHIFDCLLKIEVTTVALKIYASTGKELLSKLSETLAYPEYVKISISEIKLMVKSSNKNVLKEDNNEIIDTIIERSKRNNTTTIVEYAEIPNLEENQEYLLTHYMCIVDDLFAIFGCNTTYQLDPATTSQHPFITSYKTSAGRKLVLSQSYNFDIILKKSGLSLKSYTVKK